MAFTIKLIEGDDVMSPEYETHNEALWNLCNNQQYLECGETREEREQVLYICDSESWMNQSVECPQCKEKATWATEEMDVIECFACSQYTPYPFK